MTATKKLDLLVEKDGLSEVVLLPQKSVSKVCGAALQILT